MVQLCINMLHLDLSMAYTTDLWVLLHLGRLPTFQPGMWLQMYYLNSQNKCEQPVSFSKLKSMLLRKTKVNMIIEQSC